MVTGKSTGADKVFNIIVYTIAFISLIAIMYPLYFVILASFSEPGAVTNGRVWFWPVGFTLDGYVALFEESGIWIAYANTVFYALAGTLISLVVNLPAAFALSRRNLFGRNTIMFYFVITMFFSGGLIPTFLTVRDFGLLDTRLVMILPFSVSVFNIIVARTFFTSSIPEELWESARLDGCGNAQYFLKIALPLSKAIIAVLALWVAVGQWNSFFTAMIYLRSENLQPLQIILRRILINHEHLIPTVSGEHMIAALRRANLIRYSSIIVSTLPIMLFYPFIQKHFNQGVMIGSVKG